MHTPDLGPEDDNTRFFYALTPDRILDAVEHFGVRCTGRSLALNSMENRVYEIEIEVDEDLVRSPSDRFRVAKFYRPGRWTREQILEEHAFLRELAGQEIPAIAPLEDADGSTLGVLKEAPIFFALFPKVGGRAPDELDREGLQRLGRLLARVHTVGAARRFQERIALTPESYGLANLRFLRESGSLPDEVAQPYASLVESICTLTAPWFAETANQRIHGDCHLGNILWRHEQLFLVDFDDVVTGPCVQDFWLMIPGRDEENRGRMDLLLTGYEQMRSFDRRSLRLIEPLRALRYVHYTAWIARRWQDPAFPRTFPHFGTPQYWREQLADLHEQWELIQEIASGYRPY